jgi:pimeloyl-ACP methyl ester carboxylesterase
MTSRTWRGIPAGLTTAAAATAAAAMLVPAVLTACGSGPVDAPGTASVVSAPVRVAQTRLGAVGYRTVGHGRPLVLIMGYGWNMEGWDPRLVHALAEHNRVVMFDNSGVGRTRLLPLPLSMNAMADQTSALITALHLGRPDVLGWSMGGMIAQDLAVRHPAQVRRLVLCATFPGTGAAGEASQAAVRAGQIFPADQAAARSAYRSAVAEYPAAALAPAGTKVSQATAETDWEDGNDTAGRRIGKLAAPTLVADGTDDQLVPTVNDRILARLIPRSRMVLYPDAGHAFLFQEPARVAALIESFLAGLAAA